MNFLRPGVSTPNQTHSEKSILLTASLTVLLCMSFVRPAHAQTTTTTMPGTSTTVAQAAAPEKREVEKVEVIGTRIKRLNVEGPSAVKSIKKEAMDVSGTSNVSDVLRDSSAATGGVGREASGNSAAATSNIGLRGMGADKTLILLNGRRLPKDPSTEAVDLNLIPQSAVERVEILKDGSSALYGSDALGGVINFVTKKNFTGNEISTFYSKPNQKGGDNLGVALLNGTSSERTDFLFSLNYNRKEKIFGIDRDLTRGGLSSIGSTAAWFDPAAKKWTVVPASECPADLYRNLGGTKGNKCYFRYNELATTRPLIGQLSMLTDATVRTDSSLKFYNRNIFVMKDIEWNFAPTPEEGSNYSFSTTTGSIPGYPNASKVAYRFVEAGNRDNIDTERNLSTLFGLKGNVTDTWEADLAVGYSRVNRESFGANGYLDVDVVESLIKAGTFKPMNPAGTRGDISSAIAQTFQKSTSDLSTVDLVFSGDLGDMTDGPIGAAIGISGFNEKMVNKTDTKAALGKILGSAGSNNTGSRDVLSVYGEFSLPLSKGFEVDLAARADRYSDFGSSVNPKISSKIALNEQLLMRASVGTGYKAPTLSQLYGEGGDGYPDFVDRKACAADPANSCSSIQHHVVTSSNPKLKEEKAVTGGLGVVYEASSDFSTSADLWYTKLSNVVGIDLDDLTTAELNGVNPSDYGVTVTRDSAGDIDKITAPNLNLQSEELSGLDLNAEYMVTNDFMGHRLSLQDDLSIMIFDKLEGFPGAGARNRIGEWGSPGWRNGLNFSMKKDALSYFLTLRTIPGQKMFNRYKDGQLNDDTEIDLSASYKVSKKATFTGGVRNLLNTNPPADMVSGLTGETKLNGSLYDVNGRVAFVSYVQKF